MAKAKQQPKRILYHQFFCGEGNLGESDGFFSLESGKLEYVDGWDCNDAHWRGEYMTGLLAWAGVKIEQLPEKYLDEAVKIAEKQWGLDYGEPEDEDDEDGKDQPATTKLFFQEGSSDKVYIANLYHRVPAGGACSVNTVDVWVSRRTKTSGVCTAKHEKWTRQVHR